MSLRGGKLPHKDLLAALSPEGTNIPWQIALIVVVLILLVIIFFVIRFLINSMEIDHSLLNSQSSRATKKPKELILLTRYDVNGSDGSCGPSQEHSQAAPGIGYRQENAREGIGSKGRTRPQGDNCNVREPPRIVKGWAWNDESHFRYGPIDIV